MRDLRSRVTLGLVILLLPLATACEAGPAPAAAPKTADQQQPTAAARSVSSTPAPTATAVPPTPTPAPTPVPEPRFYATAGGGTYFAETGFTVRDEPNGPRFLTEFQRQGGRDVLGLPASQTFDGPDGARVQLFQKGWLRGTPGQAAVQAGQGNAPPAPAEAKAREDRPEMAFIGRVDVQPRQARQGTTVLLRVWSPSAQSVIATLEGRDLPLAHQGDAFVGLYAFHRVANLGPRPVRFTIVDAAGRRTTRSDAGDTITVVDAKYPIEDLVVDDNTMGLLDPAQVNQEEALLNGIESKWTPEKLWKGPFIGPVGDVAITSDFGTKRTINGVLQSFTHEGTDFDVQSGDPIHAAADGKVVFAGPLHVRGNVVIVDHGLGVYTGYFHQFQIKVQVGQMVKQGDEIGLAGSTGFVTGPHLHFEVRVQNVCVEPLEFMNQAPHERPDLASL